jgi:hypothetical protein
LRITQSRGNTFYRVYVNKEEKPYLNLAEILSGYLDFSKVQCDPQRRYCSATLASQKTNYYFDFRHGQCSSDAPNAKVNNINDQDWSLITNDFWVHYKLLEKCLPVEATWDYKLYFLSISPHYPLIDDLSANRERIRKMYLIEAQNRREIEKRNAIYPTDPFRAEVKYDITGKKIPAQPDTALLDYNLIADALQGTLSFGGQVSSSNKDASSQYWLYTLRDKKYFHLLQGGDVFFEGTSILLPSMTAKLGVILETRERTKGVAGQTTIQGYSIPKTEVELFKNGIFQKALVVGDNGIYQFQDIYASGNDRMVLKFYYPDGSDSEKIIVVADDNALLLPQDKTETRLFMGETSWGNIKYLSSRYGVLDNLSVGLHGIQFQRIDWESDDHLKIKNNSLLTEMTWLPFKSLGLFNENLYSEHSTDTAVKGNWTLLSPNIFQFQYRYLQKRSPLVFNSSIIPGRQWLAGHVINFSQNQLQSTYEENAQYQKANIRAVHNLFPSWNIFTEGSRIWYKVSTPLNNQLLVGTNIQLTRESDFRLSREWLPPRRVSTAEFLLHNGWENKWSAALQYSKVDQEKAVYSGLVTYKFNKFISLSLIAQNQGIGVLGHWTDVVAPQPGPQNAEQFGGGTLSGKILSQPDRTGKQSPMVDAIINIDGKSVRSDAEGNYTVHNITPYRKVVFKVDPLSMDISMAPKNEYEVFYFRPGTLIQYNPELIQTVGVDGVIESNGPLPPTLLIEAQSSLTGAIIATTKVESDGLFILEGLAPGKYELQLIGLEGGKVKSKQLELSPGEDWKRNFIWNID